MIRYIFFLLLFLFSYALSFAQLKDFAIEFGTCPTSVFGDNGATSVFINPQKSTTIGGGFFGFQNGIYLRGIWQKSDANFAIPIGFEYIFYRAYHRVPYAPKVTLYLRHFIDVPTVTLGFRYYLFKLPFANVKCYSEIDARGSFVGKSNYSVRIDYEAFDSTLVKSVSYKNAVFRFGGDFRIGFLGEVVYPWYVNIFTNVSYVNLLGRNNKRGELLTPVPDYEPKENPVYNFQLGIGVYYKF